MWESYSLQGIDWSSMAVKLSQISGRYMITWWSHALVCFTANCDAFMCAGIVETGLFVNMTSRVYFGNPDGTVKIKNK